MFLLKGAAPPRGDVMQKVVRVPSSNTGSLAPKAGFVMPPELLEKASARLCFISILCAVATVIFFVAEGYLQPEAYAIQQMPVIRLMMLGMVLLSFAFLGVQRAGWLSKLGVLYLGVAFQVLIGFLIGFMEATLLSSPAIPVIGVSAVALWILLCGLLIPNTPRMVALTGSLTLLSWPLAYFLGQSMLAYPFIGWNRVAMWIMPLVLAVIWTTMLNQRIFKLELESQKAEDLGSYKLERIIGQGGMGEVWLAHHRMLRRNAAVKLIRPEILSGQTMRNESVIRRRFEREARATARLRNPHTVALFDFGTTQEGMFYYVMELLEGVDLQTLVEKHGPMHPGRVKNILIQVCESLEEAHRLNMVHRDIKPRNIFLSKMGWQHDFAKVLDFGLVKTELREDESLMTMEGTATGTPAYMAPEVALNATIDGRADIYGLGCVAYFMLTGELVFAESSPTAMALAHVQKSPERPSSRTELPIPESLENVVLQCLEKDPENRPRSAQDLARKLEALKDVPVFCRDKAATWWEINLPSTSIYDAIGASPADGKPAKPALDSDSELQAVDR
jgi:eukaryotic-like serine/threonine-protein kinase